MTGSGTARRHNLKVTVRRNTRKEVVKKNSPLTPLFEKERGK
jgi:hypothetical protein